MIHRTASLVPILIPYLQVNETGCIVMDETDHQKEENLSNS
jgi:hypothetical protein